MYLENHGNTHLCWELRQLRVRVWGVQSWSANCRGTLACQRPRSGGTAAPLSVVTPGRVKPPELERQYACTAFGLKVEGIALLISISRSASNGKDTSSNFLGGRKYAILLNVYLTEVRRPHLFLKSKKQNYFQHENFKEAGKSIVFFGKHYSPKNYNKRKHLPIYRAILRDVLFSRSKKLCHIVQQSTESSI